MTGVFSLDQTAAWPKLPLQEWQATDTAPHRSMQVVEKIRLRQTPMLNH
jgi:hypothetical protein